MATIYEVAALAGVSPATVSRVLNGRSVSPEKARLVRDAAEKLNFTVNRTARDLRRQHSEVIALLVPDIENPFFTALARGVEDRAQESGYSVVLCNTDEDPAKETRYLEIANSANMAGVILAPSREHTDISGLLQRKKPVVAVDRTTGFDIDAVMVDNRSIGASATAALIDRGFRRIACIAGPLDAGSPEERSQAWAQTMRSRGLGDPAKYLVHADFRVDGGRAAMATLLELDTPPDAVVATNNLMGVGALQALFEAGLTPPAFGVAVCGELPFSTDAPASVTQVRIPARHLGTTAATLLLDRIEGDSQPARTVVLRGEILEAG
ncbi:MAG TPA: LacI family DNA-binding transcriptional regulator [Pseudolysinimonas sp.]|nr:LacI family DNA-binding transcriptional regulator [Pseudolysinimonas sp.]